LPAFVAMLDELQRIKHAGRWDGMGWDGMGREGMGGDGRGGEGMGWEGVGWDGKFLNGEAAATKCLDFDVALFCLLSSRQRKAPAVSSLPAFVAMLDELQRIKHAGRWDWMGWDGMGWDGM